MRLLVLLGALADAPGPVLIFETDGCVIDTDLHVRGSRRRACVERLEEAARLARMEMRVNERWRK